MKVKPCFMPSGPGYGLGLFYSSREPHAYLKVKEQNNFDQHITDKAVDIEMTMTAARLCPYTQRTFEHWI